VILTTLAPAGGLLSYSTLEDVPIAPSLPPAEVFATDAIGIQEVVLVIAYSGYTPIHFSVKKDAPVRVVFRQLGQVGCGNELYFTWGENQSGHLILSGPGDTQVLEFTPRETGDFLFHCPHFIYQGVMTVVD
jgi:plastocyanin domain-containing protein